MVHCTKSRKTMNEAYVETTGKVMIAELLASNPDQ
jgi:hypothetical protein